MMKGERPRVRDSNAVSHGDSGVTLATDASGVVLLAVHERKACGLRKSLLHK